MEDLQPIPISALEHYEYCPRQCALIHVDGLWTDNRHTVAGQHGHRRADSEQHRTERGRTTLRSLPLWSHSHGLIGRADIVEIWPDGRLNPVEYKIGVRHGDSAHIQLCAQALCLEEMSGRRVNMGHIWFSSTRRRLPVEFDLGLREITLARIASVRQLLVDDLLPVAVDDARCDHCQLHDQCLPGLVAGSAKTLSTSSGVAAE